MTWPLPAWREGGTEAPLVGLDARWHAGSVVALGNFDGVHAGHRTLLAQARAHADELGAPLVVVTFFPPAKVVFNGAKYLSSELEKAALLGEAGADQVVVVPFDRPFAATPAADFAAAIGASHPRAIVVGEDFRFGRDRAGDPTLLASLAPVVVVPLASAAGRVAKSSDVRAALEAGDVATAGATLGAPYRVRGRVVRGDRRGRTIGFPTANVATDPRKALPVGVFAVAVDTAAGRSAGMANVGPRPSFPDGVPALEAHLFDTAVDLYDQEITVHFLAYLRGARAFASLDALEGQLRDDERAARAVAAAWGLT